QRGRGRGRVQGLAHHRGGQRSAHGVLGQGGRGVRRVQTQGQMILVFGGQSLDEVSTRGTFRTHCRRLPWMHRDLRTRPSPWRNADRPLAAQRMIDSFPTPEKLAAEARAILRKAPPPTGHALYVRLIRKGFINARGEVTKLIGGSAEPEQNYETWTDTSNGKRQSSGE